MHIAAHILNRALAKLELRAPFSNAEREGFLALPYTLRTLEPGTYVVREGDPPRYCAVLISGFAYRQKITASGARQIISLHIPGDMLDLQNLHLNISDHNVQTLTRAEVAAISRTELRHLAQVHPAIERAFFIDALVDSSIFREWVVNVGRRDARARVAHVLCEMARRLDAIGLVEDDGYILPMTQEQLADATGLTAVHVNRTLRGLADEGLIERSKRNVRFPDWARLREVADFNERYLHLEQREDKELLF
jgi:CRP-like cAMP-binding protein